MKKFLFLALVILLATSAFAEVILAPEWSEFCPVEYLNAKPSKWSKDTDYWYNRRIQFENSISRCSSCTGNDLKSCYDQVRVVEQNKNKLWNTRLEQQKIESQKTTDMYNRIQTINTINHLIDTIGK